MQALTVRELVLEAGRPKVCAVIDGTGEKVIFKQIEVALEAAADLFVWHCDTYQENFSHNKILQLLAKIRAVLGEQPLIFCFRTLAAGGATAISLEEYRLLYMRVAETQQADLLDIELDTIDRLGSKFVANIQRQTKIIFSDYYLEEMPKNSILLFRLNLMEHAGGAVGKLVVTPENRQDIFRLMELNMQAESFVAFPIITTALGPLGKFSHVNSELSGNAVAYASLALEPQNGELNIYDLKRTLTLLHNEKEASAAKG